MTDFAQRRRMMVDTQVRPSDVTKFPIIEAMLRIPREVFVPSEKAEAAYAGRNIDLGDNRVVLDPRTFAKMLDALGVDHDDLVLDVGTGYGYSSAVIARIAQAVVAVEEDESWASDAEALLSEHADNVIVHRGPIAEGAAEHGPYDAIIVEGGVEELPDTIGAQVKEGGRIACLFVEGNLGTVRIGWKNDGHITWRFAFNASAPVLPGFETTEEFAL
ncbi:protein-L-isoaspartate O-methyltransferase family protein [Salipiger mucosus]|uniref:Protein-L-isoaspartate O-methyltransferase n=1 Tax=Salipiger mucosus DSM 16094 TaxID=1123237 RepID=S9R0D6_9RHOB|nr:protein-L-isoaspartate O-methyltransferase [Salipiger mucosus]EPX85398.1 Protein-L-isoaspartate O-methyltransferase [Salipiger mucosus DSM 16094]